MLYVLSISVIFGMILSFYLTTIVANQQKINSHKTFLTAQLMTRMTMERISEKDSGLIHFNHGRVKYQRQDTIVSLVVYLKDEGVYRFRLLNDKKVMSSTDVN